MEKQTLTSNEWITFYVTAGIAAIGLLYWAYTSDQEAKKRAAEEERRMKEAESLAATSNRNIVAAFVQRADYLHLSQADFDAWMDLNKGHLFPHEIEAMERQRAAHHSEKHPRRN